MNGCQENIITHFCCKISIFGVFAQHEFVKTSNIHPEIFGPPKSASWKVFAFSASGGERSGGGRSGGQTWKMSKTLPKQDCSFPDFTRKCANYVNFEIATKQRNLSANTMFTTFTW